MMLFYKEFYKQNFITQNKEIKAKLVENKPNEFYIEFNNKSSKWVEDTYPISFEDWINVVDNNIKNKTYSIDLKDQNSISFDKDILLGKVKKECYAVCSDFPGEKLYKERNLTVKDCLLDVIESIDNLGFISNSLSEQIETIFFEFIYKKIKEEKIIDNLEKNQVLPIILNHCFDKHVLVSKQDLSLKEFNDARIVYREKIYGLSEESKYITTKVNLVEPLDLGKKYYVDFYNKNKSLMQKAEKDEELTDWYDFFNNDELLKNKSYER